MVQGTASNVGKSILAAGLCRFFKNLGVKVAPFKSQNMANNSYVTKTGGEIGRAQAIQAFASKIAPTVEMNPILLKPTTDKKCQVVVMGKVVESASAFEYQNYKKKLIPQIFNALDHLRKSYDLIVIEGAGSPAEINLKKNDIVNMFIAKKISAPVILVGDIDKGGVFAQLIGTYQLLDPDEKKCVRAFLINKFRGDKKLLLPGLKWIEKKTKTKILGVIPYIQNFSIGEEDSVVLEDESSAHANHGKSFENKLLIHVIKLPRISNFTDFDALKKEKTVSLNYIAHPPRNILPDLLILPGTKSTIADLKFLKSRGFQDYILRCQKAKVPILGICGGFQMLGEKIFDPYGVESKLRESDGLKLIPTITVFERKKTTAQVKAIHLESNLKIEGYEIHMGCTQGRNGQKPLFKITERYGLPIEDYDGIIFPSTSLEGRLETRNSNQNGNDSLVMGTYIHGLFDSPEFRSFFLNQIRKEVGLKTIKNENKDQEKETTGFDQLAKIIEENIDKKMLMNLVEKQK